MSNTLSLSVGNVVSAALRIYRDRFKLYYSLAFQAYLWILVPIYGWAKFAAILGLISRLAFGEVSERPESLNDARRHIKPRLWNFFLAGLLVALIFFGIYLVFGIIAGIGAAILVPQVQGNPAIGGITVLLGLIALFAFIFGFIWLYSRLSIVELPIAVESKPDPSAAIGRSWTLTQGFVLRLQAIFFVAFLITLPISFIVQIASVIVQTVLAAIFPQDSGLFAFIYLIASFAIAFGSGALLIPFWQAIKAVIYYDLRTRKEGLGLEIGDSLA